MHQAEGPGQIPSLTLPRAIRDWHRGSTWVDMVMLGLRVGLLTLVCVGMVRSLAGNTYGPRDWTSFAIFGLTLVSIYALVSLGYTMVYGVLRMINFAHGDMFMAGAFGAYVFAGPFVAQGGLVGILLMLCLGGATSAAIAVMIEPFCYGPFQSSRTLSPLICAIGASFTLQYTARGLFGTGSRAYPDIPILAGEATLGSYAVPVVQVFVIAAAIVAMVALHLLVQHTRLGMSMRGRGGPRNLCADGNQRGTGGHADLRDRRLHGRSRGGAVRARLQADPRVHGLHARHHLFAGQETTDS